MIFALIVCNFLESCANLFSLGVYNHEVQLYAECYTQGTLLQFTEVATFGWVLAITLNMYLVVVLQLNFKRKDIVEGVYHGFVWGFAILAAGLPWINKAYGIAGIWCWIVWDYQIYRWVLYYIPLFLVIVTVIVLYSLIYSTVITNLKEQSKHIDSDAKQLLAKLRAYPIVFFIIYVFSITNRIYDWLSPDDSFPLYVLESLTTPIIGFVNSVVYLADPETKALWIKFLHDKGCCLRWTTPSMKHEEFQEDDGEINFDVPDVTETSRSQDPNLF